MKAALLEAPQKLSLVDLPSPALGPGQVRVQVKSVGICGSDMAAIRGDNPMMFFPVVLGHEASGIVAEVAEGSRFQPGQRVYVRPLATCGKCDACRAQEWNHCAELRILGVHVNGAYAEEVVTPEETVRLLPDDMSFDEGALIEPAAVAVHCTNRSMLRPGEKVAIFGTGVIGNMAVQVANAKGASAVMAVDVVDERLALARQMGADVTANPLKDDPAKVGLEKLGGVDVVIDFAGPRHTMAHAIPLLKPGGRIVLLVPPETPRLEVDDYKSVFRKELSIVLSRLYGADYDDAVPLIQSGKLQLKPLITHRFPLANLFEALDAVRGKEGNLIKAVLQCS